MKIKITERRIATWDCTKCSVNIGAVEELTSTVIDTKITCGCDTVYCLHWGYNGFETWVEEWEAYAQRHEQREKYRNKHYDIRE